MPQPPPRPQAPARGPGATTQGRLNHVPCPHCSFPLNFSAHADAEHGGTGWGSQGLERGAKVDCDKCGRTSRILQTEQVTLIRLQGI